MIQAMEDMFWHTATQLTHLIVPIIVIIIIFRLFNNALFGGDRRN
jgi:hypothetical protein